MSSLFILFCIILVIGLLAAWLWSPTPFNSHAYHPEPVRSYEEGITEIEKIQTDETKLPLNRVCGTVLLTHGYPTEHVILIFHGYTNCPEHFMQLARLFFDLGHNVYLPRLPRHGMNDRLTDELRYLTAEEMVACASSSFDIARGLGSHVTLLGISSGGSLVNWLAQYRDPDYAISLSAFQGINIVPSFFSRPFIHLFQALPFFYVWWDPRTGIKNPYAIEYSYPRYSFQNLSHIMRIAGNVEDAARQASPGARHILTIINDHDPAVSRQKLLELSALWQNWIGSRAKEYHFERELNLMHDVITPGLPDDPTKEVYARIIQAIQEMYAQLDA